MSRCGKFHQLGNEKRASYRHPKNGKRLAGYADDPATNARAPFLGHPAGDAIHQLPRIRQISKDALEIPQGSLYPALYRLEHHGLITAEWGQSENNRRAKYYTLTTLGRRRLREETAGWNRLASAIAAALNATSEEV